MKQRLRTCTLHETVSRSLFVAFILGSITSTALGCTRSSSSGSDASVSTRDVTVRSAASDSIRESVLRAENNRAAADIPPEIRTSHDIARRRQSARALARIADDASIEGLSAHLADDDPETLSWAAYGLGYACKGHEMAHVKMLAARAVGFGSVAESKHSTARGTAELDPRTALARALGRCGTAQGTITLRSLLKAGSAWEPAALLGLGDLATRGKELGADTVTALVDVAASERAGAEMAFYALSRVDASDAFGKRVLQAAQKALTHSTPWRILAIKTLGRAGRDLAKEAAAELLRVVLDTKNFDPAERAESARALKGLHEAGQAAASEALGHLVPDKDAAAIERLLGPEFHVLLTLVESLGPAPLKQAEPALRALSNLAPPSPPDSALKRRLATLRCTAALGLARGAYDAEVLKQCDAPGTETSELVRLASLLQRPLKGERKSAFLTLTQSPYRHVSETAVEGVAKHPELGESAASILASAVASKNPGLVATAASVIVDHPDRVMVLSLHEKRAALDPHAPPPGETPAEELSHDVAKALRSALAEQWPEDRVETRVALIEAAAVVRHPEAKSAATAACGDSHIVVRERAQKALRILGDKTTSCANRTGGPSHAALDASSTTPRKVVFTLDAPLSPPLSILLEPELSPVTATRIKSLVDSGFYKGIVIHRVVPGFVVQFGDPDGDGYGGAGTSLRCETSPVPFSALDVGMALAGRDTGSSQLFVTLSRTPHLDGEYTRVGRAEGPWSTVAQGDVITDAKVVE